MKCHVCGEQLEPILSDFPFRLCPACIVVIKKLPVLECTNCTEFSIEDHVMEKVEELLGRSDPATELEAIPYAA